MKRTILLTLVFLLISLPTLAQDTATIVGTITDPSGAAIPGADVTVSNPEKGFADALVSNAAGEYMAAKVPIGNYVITAEAAGFRKLVRFGITLSVGQIQRVDLKLTIGLVSQEITVSGSVPKVETESAAVSDVVTGSQIADLELNGRNFVALALLVPGAVPMEGWDSSAIGVSGMVGISFNGGRMVYNNWEVDGGNNTDEGSAGSLNTYGSVLISIPSLESRHSTCYVSTRKECVCSPWPLLQLP